MSYCVCFVGTQDDVKKQVESWHSEWPDAQAEYDAAKPHLLGLVALNTTDEWNNIQLDASGHAWEPTAGPRQSTCIVSVRKVPAKPLA